MQPLDPSPVTDQELLLAHQNVADALAVLDALLEIASPRQREAVACGCPFGDYPDLRSDFDAWMCTILDGTSGLDASSMPRRLPLTAVGDHKVTVHREAPPRPREGIHELTGTIRQEGTP